MKKSTEKILKGMSFEDTKKKISDDRRKELEKLGVVSEDESAIWLIDYWCKKDVRGLIQMPFSRHWIMHIEACERIHTQTTQKSLIIDPEEDIPEWLEF